MKMITSVLSIAALCMSSIALPPSAIASQQTSTESFTQIIDDGDPGFNSYQGLRSMKTSSRDRSLHFENNRYLHTRTGSSRRYFAEWNFTDLKPGQHTIFISSGMHYRMSSARYKIYDGDTLIDTVRAPSRQRGLGDWIELGTYSVSSNSLRVYLQGGSATRFGMFVDAIKIEKVSSEPMQATITEIEYEQSQGEGEGENSAAHIDILVLYSSEAKEQIGGEEAMDAFIEEQHARAQRIYDGSVNGDPTLSDVYFTVVDTQEVAGLDNVSVEEAYTRLDGNSVVHELRDAATADLVQVFVGNIDITEIGSVCGIAAGSETVHPDTMTVGSDAFEKDKDTAFFLVMPMNCATTKEALTHELSHLLGAAHEEGAPDGYATADYAHAYVHPGKITSLMYSGTSDCGSNCYILPALSNPRTTTQIAEFPGETFRLGEIGKSDNARAVSRTAQFVQHYRDPIGQNPTHCLDVNDDGLVSPQDIIIVINYINANEGSGTLRATSGPPYRDINNDGIIAAQDPLIIINAINAHGSQSTDTMPIPNICNE